MAIYCHDLTEILLLFVYTTQCHDLFYIFIKYYENFAKGSPIT